MRSSVTSMRWACATARLYSVFLLDLISARNLSFSPVAGAIVSLVGARLPLVGASLPLVGAMVLLVGATTLRVGATMFLVGATVSPAGARLALVTPSLAVAAAGGITFRTGAAPPPPSRSSMSGTSLR